MFHSYVSKAQWDTNKLNLIPYDVDGLVMQYDKVPYYN